MLLRQFHGFLRDGEGEEFSPTARDASKAMRGRLEICQRFVFTDLAADACRQLADNPDQLLKAKAQIFAPFPQCWIEFPSSTTPGNVRVTEGFMWHGDPFDIRGRESHRSGTLLHIGWPSGWDYPTVVPFMLDLDTPEIIKLNNKLAPMIEAADGTVIEVAMPTIDEIRGGIPDAIRWILAAWALLATKGMTQSVTPDMSRLNRARAAKGLYPLLGYEEIRLNIDAARAVKAKRSVGTGYMPLHPVRAHLRLLPTGKVVIVQAHMRGTPSMA